MFGLPAYVAIVLIAAVFILAWCAGFLLFWRQRLAFRRFFGIGPGTGTSESVRGVVRAILQQKVWELETSEGLLAFYNQRAASAIDTETALGIHAHADATRRDILRQKGHLSGAVVVSSHFNHTDVVRSLGLEHHLPEKVNT